MARLTSSIAGRMMMLAVMMTVITMVVGLIAYYLATAYQIHDTTSQMPPKARAELLRLIAAGQRGSDRYFELYDRYGRDGPHLTDFSFISAIALVSIVSGGLVAMVLARRISRPITAVAKAAARVSGGDRSVRVERGRTSGETGELIESFNKMAAAIEAYERERTVLTAGIAHELRTPLTILTGRLHGLIDGVIDPASGEATRLLRQVEQLSRQVEDLRTLAHADAGELALERRMIRLEDIVRGAIDDLRPSAQTHSIILVESYTAARVTGDPARLTQIVVNLLTNALKHAPAHSRITVSVEREQAAAVVRVADEGCGFPPEDAARLFMPFWRAGANKSAGRPGSGMGLTLAAKLAEAHGGHIVARNREDGPGAAFSLYLPAAPGS